MGCAASIAATKRGSIERALGSAEGEATAAMVTQRTEEQNQSMHC
eukprot:SAG31_NODE_34063_length_337_cov_0.638655_1_plen_44_part_01